jgi:hypothetical protein
VSFSIGLHDAVRQASVLDKAQVPVDALGGCPTATADVQDLDAQRRGVLTDRLDDAPCNATPLVMWVHDQAGKLSAVRIERVRAADQRARADDGAVDLSDKEDLDLGCVSLDRISDACLDLGEGIGREAVLAQLHGIRGADGADEDGRCVLGHCACLSVGVKTLGVEENPKGLSSYCGLCLHLPAERAAQVADRVVAVRVEGDAPGTCQLDQRGHASLQQSTRLGDLIGVVALQDLDDVLLGGVADRQLVAGGGASYWFLTVSGR